MAIIALIEDDQPIQQLYKVSLEARGHNVHVAGNGREGLDLVKKVSPHIILLDLMMPIMDGYEFMRQAHHHSLNHPIIVLTNLALDDVRQLKDTGNVAEIFVKVETTPHLVADTIEKILTEKS